MLISSMNDPVTKAQKPLIVRLFFCWLLVLFFFILGYGFYYMFQFQQFISTSISRIVVTPTVTSLPNQMNILLLGSDDDEKFTGNPLTQTMMVIHINYNTREVDMFSIPRDLWVKMPDANSYGKIDQAAEYNGISSAVNVVQQTFGIHVDHYAWVGLTGFIKSLDAIGGVNLDVIHPVLDNQYPNDINSSDPYTLQRLDIQAGMQHLSGEEALQYVRSRHEDQTGDFGRTQRQRQLLLSIKQTLSKDFFSDTPRIFNTMKNHIKTDITVTTATQMGLFFLLNKDIVEKQFTLSPPTYTRDGSSTDGQSILIGDATASARLLQSIFGNHAGDVTLQSLSTIKNTQP